MGFFSSTTVVSASSLADVSMTTRGIKEKVTRSEVLRAYSCLCSEITSGGAAGLIKGSGSQTQVCRVSHNQPPFFLYCLSSQMRFIFRTSGNPSSGSVKEAGE